MRVKIDMETECDALCICEYAQAQIAAKPLWLLLHRGENQNESQEASEPGLLEICELSAACVCIKGRAALNIQTQRKARGVISIWSKINSI